MSNNNMGQEKQIVVKNNSTGNAIGTIVPGCDSYSTDPRLCALNEFFAILTESGLIALTADYNVDINPLLMVKDNDLGFLLTEFANRKKQICGNCKLMNMILSN
jgi:hypothetical protein